MTQNPYPGPPPGWQPPPYPQQPQPGAYPGGQPDPGYQPQGYPPADAYGQQFQPPAGPNPFTQTGPAGAPVQPDGDPFGNPGVPRGGGDQPALHQLGGRLLLIRPVSYNPTGQKPHPSNPAAGPTPLVIAEMVICDGEPIAGNINGETEQFTPFAAGPKAAPFYCGSMFISGAVLPGQLEDYVQGRGFCLGRLTKGTPSGKGKPPWILADPTEADKVLGRQIHAQWDQIKAAGQQARPDQFGAPVGQPQYQQAPAGPPQGYGYPQPGQQPYQPQPVYPQPGPAGAPAGYPPY